MYLRVKAPEGEVKITAPLDMPSEKIEAFLLSKRDWIEKKRISIQSMSNSEAYRYQSGEIHSLFGKNYILDVSCGPGQRSAAEQDGRLILKIHENDDFRRREKLLYDYYRQRLKNAIEQLAPHCEATTGVSAREWRIKDMKTRWGTCNIQDKRVWINLQLARKPLECLEYIMIHELVHLLERGHNKIFWGYMDLFYPNWRQARTRLGT